MVTTCKLMNKIITCTRSICSSQSLNVEYIQEACLSRLTLILLTHKIWLFAFARSKYINFIIHAQITQYNTHGLTRAQIPLSFEESKMAARESQQTIH